MTAFQRAGRRIHAIKVPLRAGGWVSRTTRTRHGETAKKMQAMIDELGPQGARAWDVLERVIGGTLAIPVLWDLWVEHRKDLTRVRAHLDDVDLEPWVGVWAGVQVGIAKDTAMHYVSAVRSLMVAGKPFKRSALTADRIQQWLDGMAADKPATIRKRGTGLRRFIAYLRVRLVLFDDPMRDITLPAPGAPRCHYLETVDAMRLADAQPAPFCAFSALLAGSGIDVSVALTIRRRDVDVANREIRAAGTKTYARDRVVRVAEWAWHRFESMLEGLHPDALVFGAIKNRWIARDAHAEACRALEALGFRVFAGYTMRDHRHTYAVRAIRAGTPAELVARQMGHVDAVLVGRVYGRFSPSQSERDKWERIAAAQDAAAEVRE